MYLTIYHDGQYWIGVVEYIMDGRLKAFRYVFGAEPKDEEVLQFIYHKLNNLINCNVQRGVAINGEVQKKTNPKRIQRQVAKELKKTGISTKAQESIQQAYELNRQKKQKRNILVNKKEIIRKTYHLFFIHQDRNLNYQYGHSYPNPFRLIEVTLY